MSTTTITQVLDQQVTATPWKSKTGWLANRLEPGCFFIIFERTVTHRWTQRTANLVWGPWKCKSGWALRGKTCYQTKYEAVRDKQGWPTRDYHLVTYSVPAERSPQWEYGAVEEHSYSWDEIRLKSWRISDIDVKDILRVPSGRVFRGDVLGPLPDAHLLEVLVDDTPLEIGDEFMVSDFASGSHDVVLSVEYDGHPSHARLTVHVVSRIRFGSPMQRELSNSDSPVVWTVPIHNRTEGELVARLDVSDVPPGWAAYCTEPFARIPGKESADIEVVAVELSRFEDEAGPQTCSLTATIVTDETDAIQVCLPVPRTDEMNFRAG